MGYNYQEADINIRKTSNFQTKKYQILISQAMTKDELKNMLWYLHNTTFRDEKQIQNSKQCGCFHCGRIFPAETVTEGCDESENEDKTAKLEVTSVKEISQNLLKERNFEVVKVETF